MRTSTSFSIRKSNWNTSGLFPELIYIDTNVVLDIMEQRSYGEISEEYLQELIQKDGMITWSNHLIEELHDFFHYQIYNEEAEKIGVPSNINNPHKWLENTATDQQSSVLNKLVVQKVNQAIEYLEQFGVQFDPPNTVEVNNLATNLYANYGTNYKDSKHVAIATLAGTNNILTQDAGYLKFPNVNVFGASSKIVNNSNSIVNDSNSFVDLRELFQEDNKKNKKSG